MAEIFSRDELNQCSKEVLITLFLNLQEQMIEMNGKLDRLADSAENVHKKSVGSYGR